MQVQGKGLFLCMYVHSLPVLNPIGKAKPLTRSLFLVQNWELMSLAEVDESLSAEIIFFVNSDVYCSAIHKLLFLKLRLKRNNNAEEYGI